MQDFVDTFRHSADPVKAEKMSAYMRNLFPFLGIMTPLRKQLCRDLYARMDKKSVDWEFVFTAWEQPEREFQYVALDYLMVRKKVLTPADIENLRRLTVEKSWWDSVDIIDALVGEVAWSYPQVNETLLEWSVDANFWLRRVAIDHQLGRRANTDTVLLETIIVNNFGQREFFVNKAIGWALREYSKTNSEWVRNFLVKYRTQLSPLSIREAGKYL